MDQDDDRPREECGVFGVYDIDDAANHVILGLHALQHRGQEGAGVVSFDGENFHAHRELGLVADRLNRKSVIEALEGKHAIGHNRYSTSGGKSLAEVQPIFAELNSGGCALAHNGNLTNAKGLRKALIAEGAIFQSSLDTEVLIHLLARSKRTTFSERLSDAVSQIEGGFALVAMTRKKMVGLRDPNGIRPLVIGELNGKPVLASETCALDIIGANFVRTVTPGEMVIFDNKGENSYYPFGNQISDRLCVFEYIYFSRPDSVVEGRSVYTVRTCMGEELAREAPADVDMVIAVPDSGVPAAIGYAREINKPFELGIIRNHYVGRTFIEPTQSIRSFGVKLKHNANRALVQGKKIVLVDDSLVRGTTARKIIDMMRQAGAKEVHLRISAPPIKFSDYYGIDLPTHEELMAHTMSVAEMTKSLGVDSLQFLSVDGLYRALGVEERDEESPQFTDHCFTGDYPTRLADIEANL